jgi:hypothetical protein
MRLSNSVMFMRPAEVALSVAFPLAVATGVALTMGGSTPGEFAFAKAAFWLAAADLAFLTVWWLLHTDFQIWKTLFSAAIGAGLVILLPQLLKWVDQRQEAAQRNFAYIDVSPTNNGMGALYIRNKTGAAFPNAQVDLGSPVSDIKHVRFYSFIPEHGVPFWDNSYNQVNIPPGEYLALITAQNGTFAERLAFRFKDNQFQKIIVVQEGNTVLFKEGDAPPLRFFDNK